MHPALSPTINIHFAQFFTPSPQLLCQIYTLTRFHTCDYAFQAMYLSQLLMALTNSGTRKTAFKE